jgi:hypothetical protein
MPIEIQRWNNFFHIPCPPFFTISLSYLHFLSPFPELFSDFFQLRTRMKHRPNGSNIVTSSLYILEVLLKAEKFDRY